MDPKASDNGLEAADSGGFSLILIPTDVLVKLHVDFSEMVGVHLAERVFYQTGFRCGEVSSSQYEDFDFKGDERVNILEEMINQSGFGNAQIDDVNKLELEITLTDLSDQSPVYRPPELIFAAGFIAGFASALDDIRYKCSWDQKDNVSHEGGPVRLVLTGMKTVESLLGKSIEDALKEDR